MYKISWFITNSFFVASLIATLFLHRAVTLELEKESYPQQKQKIKNLKFVRLILLIGTILLFVSMCASFIADMYTNG